jgi:predicted ATP-grasp superfamily ATP-dependent carboligase
MRHIPINQAAAEVLRGLQQRRGHVKFQMYGDGDGHVKDSSNAWEEVRMMVALVIPKFKRRRFHVTGKPG